MKSLVRLSATIGLVGSTLVGSLLTEQSAGAGIARRSGCPKATICTCIYCH
jgi:hypothetical protein